MKFGRCSKVFTIFAMALGLSFLSSTGSQAQGCFPGLGAVIDQFRCKKNDIIKGFPQGSGNGGGQPVVPRSTPLPNAVPRPVLRPLPQSVQPQAGQPLVDAPIEQPRQPAPRARQFVIYNSVDLYGGDYARSKKGTWFTKQRCVEICRAESTCIAFTYNVKHGVCFLKDELPQYRKSYKGAISGVLNYLRQPPRQANYRDDGDIDTQPRQPRSVPRPPVRQAGSCGQGYTTYDRTDFRGNDIAGYKVSFRSCRNRCNSSEGCAGFSWIKTKARKRCWLKYDTSAAQRKRNVLSCVKLGSAD